MGWLAGNGWRRRGCGHYTVKTDYRFYLFPARESLVSDIPAGSGKMASLFFSVGIEGGGGGL